MLVLVDAGHLLAGVGRCLGVGAPRVSGRFDLSRLVDALLSVLPGAAVPRLRWYDGLLPGASTLDAPTRDDVEAVALLVRGGRQRHVEAAVARDLLGEAVEHPGGTSYLVGDPRRHAVALQAAERLGHHLCLIGVSDAERTPADRLWLRRPDLWPALRPEARPRPPRRRRAADSRIDRRSDDAGTYQRPAVAVTPVRLPGAVQAERPEP